MSPASSSSAALGHSLPIGISRVTKTYGKLAALNDVSLDIRSGEFMTLLGPSGSGKTTLLMVLAGFIRPDHGSIRFGEEEVVLKPPHKRGIGMMFQNYALFPHMTVAANIAYPLTIQRRPKAEIAAAVDEMLKTVQLEGYGSRRISELSGGQKQRIALARAVVSKPKILLMDEPLSALDKNLRELMQLELRNMHERLGMTTVLVTHDQREALTMSDRIAVLRTGRIAQIDTSDRLYNIPATAFIADFMGESSFLQVRSEGGRCFYGDQPLQIVENTEGEAPGGILVLRPEKLDIIRPGRAVDDFNLFEGVMERVLFQGESCLAFVRLTRGDVVTVRRHLSESNSNVFPANGEKITLGLHRNESRVVAKDSGS